MTLNFPRVFFFMCTCWLTTEADISIKGSTDLPFHTVCERDCGSAPKAYYCGNNGRTYDSYCRVLQAKCSDPYLNVTEGKCRNNGRCRKERTHILEVRNLPNYTQSANVPSCNKDGSYAPTQCSVYLRYCWCVTRLGELRRNTTFEIGGATQSCETNRSNKKCKTQADLAAFALKLRSLITSDGRKRHRHLPPPPSPDMQRDTVNRKHNDMDKNHDGSLNNREMRKLLKKYRKKVTKRMRSCIKTFTKYCDLDENKRVSAAEWSFCLGFQQNPGGNDRNPRETHSNRSANANRSQDILSNEPTNKTWDPDQPQGTSPSSSTRTCREERIELLKGHKKNVNIPECVGPNEELYKQVQCHGRYCYCVVRETGLPVLSVRSVIKAEGLPNCEGADSPDVPHPIPGCPTVQKPKFLHEVRQLLISEMYRTGHDEEGDLTLSLKERAARWYFDHVDKNGDGVLGRNEKGFKKLLNSGKKLPKKCLKKFPQHCDRNKDSRTTLDEFIGCLEVRRQHPRLSTLNDLRGLINKLETTEDPDNL